MSNTEEAVSTETLRTAVISRNDDKPIGACIFLTESELHTLGIDPEIAETIEYGIAHVNGQPRLNISEVTDTPGTGTLDSIGD